MGRAVKGSMHSKYCSAFARVALTEIHTESPLLVVVKILAPLESEWVRKNCLHFPNKACRINLCFTGLNQAHFGRMLNSTRNCHERNDISPLPPSPTKKTTTKQNTVGNVSTTTSLFFAANRDMDALDG